MMPVQAVDSEAVVNVGAVDQTMNPMFLAMKKAAEAAAAGATGSGAGGAASGSEPAGE